ncbi:LOW QUALITY PROTEIN: uncharacterized protein [Palaemon carinicauda]|uniref:LOW QUALITY PROTEIN: uncharacterized protein n=1 Tax=Palaemon carinicauda TaxID=392227 RepID=UPI0035B59FD1
MESEPVYHTAKELKIPNCGSQGTKVMKWHKVVRCQETACTAVLQQSCRHEVCRSHAGCAVQVDDLLVWHPEGCEICYALVSDLTSDSTTQAIKTSSLATLKIWVGGFGRNVKAKKPYILAEDMCALLYPNAMMSAAVVPEVAVPIITRIREETQVLPEDLEGLGEAVLEDVAAINLDVEPMVVNSAGQGREVSEAGGARSKIPTLSLVQSNSSITSFHRFTGKVMTGDKSCSAAPKVKHMKKALSIASKPSKLPKPLPTRPSSASRLVPDSAVATPPYQGSRGRSSKGKTPGLAFDPVASSSQLMEKMGSIVKSQIGPIADRLQSMDNLAQRLQNQENLMENLLRSGLPQQQQFVVPDASKLPVFVKNNPRRLALHAPFSEGMLTIEGCGTRPVEDFEFYPAGLQFPFPGYARLTEEALVRVDKVPKETVIYPKEQVQSAWVWTLNEWDCVNTKLTPHKGTYTMFVVERQTPTSCTTKVVDLTLQAAMEDKPMLLLKETDLTSLLFPGDQECWIDTPATSTAGKLNPDCATTQFSERLPRLSDSLIKTEYEARTRLSRSINSATMAEMTSLVYDEEPLFKILTKCLLHTLQCDAYNFAVARHNCRKHVLAEASIRHEPNRLIKASIWGADLFPGDMVNSVLVEAARVNQSLRVRWGLIPKRKFELTRTQSRGRKKPRKFQSFQGPQAQAVVQAMPVSQMSQPSTSKAQPQQQYVWVSQPPQQSIATTPFTASPAYNPSFETQGVFHGYNSHARGSRARGAFRHRGSGGASRRGREFRGSRGSRPSANQ